MAEQPRESRRRPAVIEIKQWLDELGKTGRSVVYVIASTVLLAGACELISSTGVGSLSTPVQFVIGVVIAVVLWRGALRRLYAWSEER